LQALITKGKASVRKLAHARVLHVDEARAGHTDEEMASALNLSVRTIERVRERFVEQGFAATLLSALSKRVYARTFDGANEARLIALASGTPPEGKSRWTLDQLNTHSAASFYQVFPPDEARRLAGRLEIHHTPQHGSWLNRAEIEFSVLVRDWPERVGTRAALKQRISA
jgi:hypothetical protein